MTKLVEYKTMDTAALDNILPKHKCGLHLTHNQHRDYYESVEKYFENPWMSDFYVHPLEKAKMIETDSIWELQWYPDTPISFYKVIGATLDSVLKQAAEVDARIALESSEKPAGEFL